MRGRTWWVTAVVLVAPTDDAGHALFHATTLSQRGEPGPAAYTMALSPDGRTLVSVNTSAWLWEIGMPDDPYAAVCRSAGRSLTAEEARTYAPGERLPEACG
ncbi:hypothetical protein [Cryptosporangium aurantiacum]|uniref:WD40-like Beta Propeller Repeat n=1 Tax=Cryptosporangium aurantiacum TaxID=134849 RepID=A0A1M7R2T4_9ACTN|nr:hypothetical protein [Cryptosporangium aurantiacum]SHN38982.1 hypothetical protein SAMN05443668_106174 [Cryptosporangium aurantiacum]